MSNEKDPPDIQTQLGISIAQSKNNAEQIVELRRDLTQAIRDLGERLQSVATPNFGTIWAAVGVVTAVLLGVGAIVATGFQREMDRQDSLAEKIDARHAVAEMGLDTKLQREQQLITQAVDEKIRGLQSANEERHLERVRLFEQMDRRVAKLDDFLADRTRSDLEELRQRRQNDAKAKP